MILNVIDAENVEKTRKLLNAASIFTITVSSLTIDASNVSIFGLNASASTMNLISVGQIAVLAILLLFLLHTTGELLIWILNYFENDDEKFKEDHKISVESIYAEIDSNRHGPPMKFEDLDPWDQHYFTEMQWREKRRSDLLGLKTLYTLAINNLTKRVLPILLAILATFYPDFIFDLISLHQRFFAHDI